MSTNPNWTREEAILALEAKLKIDAGASKRHAIAELSQTLNQLKIHPEEGRALSFRNPQGVRLRVDHYDRLDSPLRNIGQVFRDVAVEFGRDISQVTAAAAEVRGRVYPRRSGELNPKLSRYQEIDLEDRRKESWEVSALQDVGQAEARESALVNRFVKHLESRGVGASRLKISPPNDLPALYCDIYVPAWQLIVEAKGAIDRPCIRMAIGQLLDYARFVEGASGAILIPRQPSNDLVELATSVSINVIWEEAAGFLSSKPLP